MIRTYHLAPLGLLLAASLTAGQAGAIDHAAHLPQGLELVSGTVARPIRGTTAQPPRTNKLAYERFKTDIGGKWLAVWDEATGVPLRIFGSGAAAPGAVASATAAQKHAETMLARHIALFAPGASASDFVPAANVVFNGQRVVSFFQHHAGMRVLGGQLSFRFKNDRLFVIASEALPQVAAKAPVALVSAAVAEAKASSWIAAEFGPATLAAPAEGPFVLPVVTATGVHSFRTVVRVVVETASPIARFDVFVDASTGDVVAREQTLRFATSTLHINAPVRGPLAERQDFPAQFARIDLPEGSVETDEAGLFTIPDGGPVDGEVLLNGSLVRVHNDAGVEAAPTFSFEPDGTFVWSEPEAEYVDSQLTAFVHTKVAKDYAKTFAPELDWLDDKFSAHVNIDDSCNAYYDGGSINFFRSSGQCENTGRVADVVYHEFGHGIHDHSIIPGAGAFDGALSEGVSDYFSSTLTGDPAMGRGFFKSQQPLRHIDPAAGEKVWPKDVTGEVHEDGLIIGGTLWDLRKKLVAELGEVEGVALANSLWWQAMRTASDIPSMYPEILAADDDDGDLSNGTPHVCEIIEVFGAHGLRTLEIETSELSVELPTQHGYDVSITVNGLFEQCGNDTVESATVVWGLQRQASQSTTITMEDDGTGHGYTARIPEQLSGEVIRYRVEVALGSGQAIQYPDNVADPLYQFFVGEVETIYCTDFEADPLSQGWTHGLLEGNEANEGSDDWMWGFPRGNAQNGDPPTAFSGLYVFGNDLSPQQNWNGHYQRNIRNYADSPPIDASGYKNVRLQYRRWLNVEDGHFDQGNIYVNGHLAWTNLASQNEDAADFHHTDREWRFHDIDITKFRSEDGIVQVRYEMASDQGLQLGGWTIDDFCVVAYEGDIPGANCGNGMIDPGEGCDDGNVTSGDGCDAFCAAEDDLEAGDPEEEGGLQLSNGCACNIPGSRDRGEGALFVALGAALAISRRNRRRLGKG